MDEMDEMDSGGGTADQTIETHELDDAWNHLVESLAAHLARMTDDGDHLVIELPEGHDGGTTPYAQFAGFGHGLMVRTELGGDAYLTPAHQLSAELWEFLRLLGWQGNDEEELNWFVERPLGDAKLVSAMVVGALREAYGVVHPLLLTYRAWGPAAAAAAELGLSATAEVPVELPESPASPESPEPPMALVPDDRDDLVEMVLMTLDAKYGGRPDVDDDGDVMLTQLDQPVWVRARAEQPAVEIFARVAHAIHSRRATAAELAVLNRDNPWVKWTLRERTVWQHIVIPAMPFAPTHLDAMLDVFLETMTATRDDLAFRVGGRVA